jgi:hypothetical protein
MVELGSLIARLGSLFYARVNCFGRTINAESSMPVVYRQATYKVPGTYQWVKPPTANGAGPYGSTYLETIVTVIGPGSGGESGAPACDQGSSEAGGAGGNGGGYGQATYLPATLNAIENIVVAAGSVGGTGVTISGAGAGGGSPNKSAATATSSFGAHITCNGGGTNVSGVGGTASVSAGSNVTSVKGGTMLTVQTNVSPQLEIAPGISPGAGLLAWNTTGNNAGASGGSVNNIFNPIGGTGGGVAPTGGGGLGLSNSAGTAQAGLVNGAGGGAAGAVSGIFPLTGGAGAPGYPNSGAGGGGGGAAASTGLAGGGTITSGAGGNGSHGLVQVTDIFTLPPLGNPYYFNFDLITWFHMMNMARPISLTGRYAS